MVVGRRKKKGVVVFKKNKIKLVSYLMELICKVPRQATEAIIKYFTSKSDLTKKTTSK